MRLRAPLAFVIIAACAVFVLTLRRFQPPSAEPRASASPSAAEPLPPAMNAAGQEGQDENFDAELAGRLKAIVDGSGANVGLALVHVESGRYAEVNGSSPAPLYSVFKLPLAITVLKDVEENRLRLDRKVRVTPSDVAPGWKGNSDLWRRPVERTVAELLETSIVRSDNTSSDKLLEIVGGAAAVTERMRALGFQNIDIHWSVREFSERKERPNTGTARDLARLLVRLQKGEVLGGPHLTLLLGLMERATSGAHRLRGRLPRATPVADKSGTGEQGSATNDVGLITLPEGRGHLAMAVFVIGSKLPAEAQEKLIAELARTAYDAHVSGARSSQR